MTYNFKKQHLKFPKYVICNPNITYKTKYTVTFPILTANMFMTVDIYGLY